MSDGTAPVLISGDIRDKFDPKHANYIGAAALATCTAWIDPVYHEYHWVIPDSTQWVYDLKRKRWYEAPLAASKRLLGGLPVYDTNGVAYSYGFTSSGYLYRTENGTTFDSAAIAHTLQTGDMAPTGAIMDRTEVVSFRLVGKAKTVTAETVSLSHYGDSSTTASTPSPDGMSMANSGKRLFSVSRSFGRNPKTHVYHSFKTTVSTSDETVGFEPIFFTIGYINRGKDTR
jgi:hypothetical protein